VTEKTLEQAIEIKRVIDKLRNVKEELEETRNLCFGNTNEVRDRTFYVEISEKGCCKKDTIISPQAAKKALECEIGDVDEKLKKNLNALSELY